MVSHHASVVATKEQVCSDLAGEAVILDLKAGVYYGLNDVGARIWNLTQEPKTVNEIRGGILSKYLVDPEQREPDILALLQ